MNNWGCNDLRELLDYAPSCVEHKDKIYCLHFYKSTHGFIVEYSFITEKMHVDMQGIKFIYRENLFDTYRRDDELFKALSNILSLLHENKSELKFIPRTHPFNNL